MTPTLSPFLARPTNSSMSPPSRIALAHSRVNSPSSEGRSRSNVGIAPSHVGARVCAFLRARYPDGALDNVAADLSRLRVPRDTVRNMLERETAPGAVLLFALIEVYGPAFLAAAFPSRLGWLDEAVRAQRKAEYVEARAALERAYEDCL